MNILDNLATIHKII